MSFKLPHNHGEEGSEIILKEALDRREDFEKISDIFKQLSDATRTRIFWLLCHREECVINISEFLGMSSPAVSHHLRTLKNKNLIISRRVGKEVYYKSADNEAARELHKAIEKIMDIACP